MIIFELDGTLADCEHRRHFVDPSKNSDYECHGYCPINNPKGDGWYHKRTHKKFKPDWKSFYESCDQDIPIEPSVNTFRSLSQQYECEIWSGRCESVKQKTIQWLYESIPGFAKKEVWNEIIKMRPTGNSDPDDELKEMWLHDAKIMEGQTIDYVFDDRPKVIRMWRRHGIFVFNCCQHDEEF